MTTAFPTLFVPHGAPTFALAPGAAGAALAEQARSLPQPRAIIMISAHWSADTLRVGSAPRPDTVHDFWGFPDALYRIRYPASGCPEAAAEVARTLADQGLDVACDPRQGLDHGAWVPLRLMYPDAEVPVIPLSLPNNGGPEAAWALGQALAPLTERGFLIIGSGSITHSLRDFHIASQRGSGTPDYVIQFADWLAERCEQGDLSALFDYRRQAPEAARAHPTEEHLLPFFVALGAAGNAAHGQRFYRGIDDFVIAMDAYLFTRRPPV